MLNKVVADVSVVGRSDSGSCDSVQVHYDTKSLCVCRKRRIKMAAPVQMWLQLSV